MQKCLFQIMIVLSITCIVFGCSSDSDTCATDFAEPVLYEVGNIKVLELHGNYYEMGKQYGSLLKDDLQEFYALAVEDYFVSQAGFSIEFLKQGTRTDFELYPERFKNLLYGIAETSGMALDELIVLDQIIVIAAIAEHYEACSAISAWGDYTDDNKLVFGRNFDWFDYFRDFSKFLTVFVYNPDDGSIPTASVGYTGQIQTLNGINQKGIFLEMNAGSLSDDTYNEDPMIPTNIQLLSFLFDLSDLAQFDASFNTSQTNVAFIINVANEDSAYSYEWATFDVKKRVTENEGLLVATNHFVHPDWGISPPSEDHSSMVRRNNLLSLGSENKGRINAQKMMEILDLGVEDGGATKNPDTIFQIVAVPQDLKLWVKIPSYQDWTEIDLNDSFE